MKKQFTAILLVAALILGAAPAMAGTLMQARCDCGYTTGDMRLFGGRDNFKTVCYFPAYCPGVKKVLVVNMFVRPPASPECPGGNLKIYDKPPLIGEPGNRNLYVWNMKEAIGRNLIITNGTYLCPKCGQYRLRFTKTGKWD